MVRDLDSFWKWVDNRMAEVGITSYRDLARRAGVSHGTISQSKNSLRPPTVETAEGLCKALKVTWVELWTEAGFVDRYDLPNSSDLDGLDADIYYAMLDVEDDFKRAVLKTIKTWLVLYNELRK